MNFQREMLKKTKTGTAAKKHNRCEKRRTAPQKKAGVYPYQYYYSLNGIDEGPVTFWPTRYCDSSTSLLAASVSAIFARFFDFSRWIHPIYCKISFASGAPAIFLLEKTKMPFRSSSLSDLQFSASASVRTDTVRISSCFSAFADLTKTGNRAWDLDMRVVSSSLCSCYVVSVTYVVTVIPADDGETSKSPPSTASDHLGRLCRICNALE